jgi:ribosomal protein L37AE/L43A
VFGAGMFSKDQVKFKGLQTGVTGLLWRALKKREKDTSSFIILTVDECRTSKVCSSCKNSALKVPSIVKGYGVLQCEKCGIVWNRDTNAAKNMLVIAQSTWSGNGHPPIYNPKPKNTSA